jgi:hypothetical protein
MIVIANSGSINFKKTGSIRTGRVLSKKGEKKELDFFLVLLPEAQLSVFTGKCQILFVYLRDSNGVNTGDI